MSSVPSYRLSKFYFAYFATLGIFLPYWAIYLKSLGFGAAAIGQLVAMIPATKIIAPIMWGWLADRFRCPMRVVKVTALLAVVLFASMYQAHSYWHIVAATLAFSFFWNASLPLFEAVTLSFLEHDPHRYSLIRLWGSLGFIAAVSSVGVVLDYYPPVILLHIIFGLLLFIWLVSLTLPEPERSLHQKTKGSLLFILKHPTVIALLIVFLLIQISHGPYYVFYSLYLEQQGYSSTETGILWALGVLAEVVIFMLMPRMLARFRLKSIIVWSLVLCIIRWILIAQYANQPSVLYFAQLLHAATFGSAHVAAVHMVHRHFGAQYQGTGQALYASISFGLGGMLGSFASGWLWEQIGAQLVFICAAATCVIGLMVAWFGISDEDTRTEHADLLVVEEEL